MTKKEAMMELLMVDQERKNNIGTDRKKKRIAIISNGRWVEKSKGNNR